ncbi:MAG: response regulator [Roseburia sp.]|nr:response regulator [Roseburia sp.]MCM1098123.1 response regulator [Ruminococcus flavefaciens]
MLEKLRKKQRLLLITLIIVCMGTILAVGIGYVQQLRRNLQANAVQDVMNVTLQQRQALDTFISADKERLHSYASYFSQFTPETPEDVDRLLGLFNEIDATYLVTCLDEAWVCCTYFEGSRQLTEEQLEVYSSLSGSGVRDTYIGFFSGIPRFGYYETFTFANGHKGVITKSYDRSKVSEAFSLSFYGDQGLSYLVNREGEILLRSVDVIRNDIHENIFDIIADIYGEQAYIDNFQEALLTRKSGSTVFDGDRGAYLYTYVPIESEAEWTLVSIVPVTAIRSETDHILQNTQATLWLLGLILVVCGVFVLLVMRTQREIQAKDQTIDYQAKMFDIFTTYLSHNTDDVYMMFDHETEQLEYVSPNAERVLGVPPEELVGYLRDSDRRTDAEAAEAFFRQIRALTPGESTTPRSTERINPKTGEYRYFLENAYCTDLQDSVKCVAYLSDRTKERKSQDQLTEALHMARAASKSKSAFLSSVSHDIRTPMNAIIGFLSLLRNETENPRMVQEYVERIDAASQHLLGLINDVLDMNKIESGGATLNIAEIKLPAIIDEINTITRPQANAKKQTFDIFVSRLNHEHLLGDKMRINQILINLLSNAVKYTPENGTIQMRVEELPQAVSSYSRIRFTVSDNGLGMSEDYLKVIFEPFTREETKITNEIQGTGLGMAITKSLVDLMGGVIHVESKPGRGSTFTVELELRIQEQDDDPRFWDEFKVTRMIAVDDDEDICKNIVKTMAKTGVATDYATDGKTAVDMMRSNREAGHPYDLILLDWQMPDLDGLETARLIRKNYSDRIPILLLTAYDWSDIEAEAKEIGVNHFMPKPFFMSTFKDAIRRVMGGSKKAADTQSAVFTGRHILVVDDIEVNRIILVKILSSLGADCDTASNGQEAVDLFTTSEPGRFDLILMDVQMPVMDGYEATRTIRSSSHPQAKEIAIIAMTANAFVDDVREAIVSGMDAHIAKPVQIDKLKATIQQVMEKWDMMQIGQT